MRREPSFPTLPQPGTRPPTTLRYGCASVRQGRLNLDHCIEVADETGEVVAKVSLRDAFTIEG
jgi:hypothetical protein